MLVFLYHIHYAFTAPVRLTVHHNLRTQYSLYTSENPTVTNSASFLTSSYIINTSHGGLVSKAKEQRLVA